MKAEFLGQPVLREEGVNTAGSDENYTVSQSETLSRILPMSAEAHLSRHEPKGDFRQGSY